MYIIRTTQFVSISFILIFTSSRASNSRKCEIIQTNKDNNAAILINTNMKGNSYKKGNESREYQQRKMVLFYADLTPLKNNSKLSFIINFSNRKAYSPANTNKKAKNKTYNNSILKKSEIQNIKLSFSFSNFYFLENKFPSSLTPQDLFDLETPGSEPNISNFNSKNYFNILIKSQTLVSNIKVYPVKAKSKSVHIPSFSKLPTIEKKENISTVSIAELEYDSSITNKTFKKVYIHLNFDIYESNNKCVVSDITITAVDFVFKIKNYWIQLPVYKDNNDKYLDDIYSEVYTLIKEYIKNPMSAKSAKNVKNIKNKRKEKEKTKKETFEKKLNKDKVYFVVEKTGKDDSYNINKRSKPIESLDSLIKNNFNKDSSSIYSNDDNYMIDTNYNTNKYTNNESNNEEKLNTESDNGLNYEDVLNGK